MPESMSLNSFRVWSLVVDNCHFFPLSLMVVDLTWGCSGSGEFADFLE